MKNTALLAAICAIPLSILSGCGGGSEELCDGISVFGGCQTVTDTTVPPPPPPTLIEVAETEVFVLNNGREVQAAKDQILIYLKEDVTQAEYDAVVLYLSESGAIAQAFNEALRLLQVQFDSTVSELSLISEIEILTGVDSAGLNQVVVLNSSNDNAVGYADYISDFQLMRSLPYSREPVTYTAQATIPSFLGDYWIGHIDLGQAQDIEDELSGLFNVTIGIVDTGIGAGQTVLEAGRLSRYNKYGEPMLDDDSSSETEHGLWATAFAAGNSNATGVSRNSRVIHIDVYKEQCLILDCSSGIKAFTSDVFDGIITAINKGADVINVSWGDSSTCSDSQEQRLKARQALRKTWSSAVAYAKREDRLLLFPAGNNCEKQDDRLLLTETDLEADPWLTHAVIVAATDETKTDASFSGMGAVVNIAAPGKDIGYGVGDIPWWSNENINSGTSFSTPLTTGVAALIKGISGTLSAPEIRYILRDTAVRFASDATAPNILLNAGNAANSAKSTVGVEFESLSTVSLSKNETRDVNFSITIPEKAVKSLDVVFLIDVSGSYEDDINTLQNKAKNIISDLAEVVEDVQFGVASFSDFPLSNPNYSNVTDSEDDAYYGSFSDGDKAYFLHQKITSDITAVTSAINKLDQPLHNGEDSPESQLEALYQIATGIGRDINGNGGFTDTGDLEPKSIGWRTSALRVVLFATDAYFHNSDSETSYPGAGKTETIAALKNANIRVIGLQSGNNSKASTDIRSITDNTNGSKYFLSSNSAEIAQAIFEGLDVALEQIDITIEKISGSEWITNITPMSYADVLPGSERRFTVSLLGQKFRSMDELQYDIYLWVRGDGSAVLKRVKIPVVVPAL
ncbi:MAG: S8 family serine peptidase [bacterium]|nr:S8 family serine peptidase [bacterium]